jgi:ribosomal-protein-alanine N-acetyltransferase
MKLDIGQGLAIRSFEASDAAAIVKYADNKRVWLGLRDAFPHHYTPKDAREWIDRAMNQEPECNFAIATADELIGGIGVGLGEGERRLSAEVGYWLGEPFWGKGIATRAVVAFTDYAFETYDLVRAYADVFSDNTASARVLEKAGYRVQGRFRNAIIKDGKVLDLFVYERLSPDVAKP